jgi:hypothetical protein
MFKSTRKAYEIKSYRWYGLAVRREGFNPSYRPYRTVSFPRRYHRYGEWDTPLMWSENHVFHLVIGSLHLESKVWDPALLQIR